MYFEFILFWMYINILNIYKVWWNKIIYCILYVFVNKVINQRGGFLTLYTFNNNIIYYGNKKNYYKFSLRFLRYNNCIFIYNVFIYVKRFSSFEGNHKEKSTLNFKLFCIIKMMQTFHRLQYLEFHTSFSTYI